MPVDELTALDADRLAPHLGEAPGTVDATTIGRSAGRRRAGLTGQYALLVVLAALVLAPVVFTLIQALSSPAEYIQADTPFHPVAVDWKDRTWFSGGLGSVLGRTALVFVALAWAQLAAAGGSFAHPQALAAPRRLGAVVTGTVAVALLTTPVFGALRDRSGGVLALWLLAIVVVAATQALGMVEPDRAPWKAALLALSTAVAVVSVAIVGTGAAVWTNSWDQGRLGPALWRSFVVAVLITVAQVVTSVLAAYAFAFLRFPFKPLVFAFFMGTLLLPLEVTLLANVQTIRELGWIDTNAGLVLPFAATAFGTFLVRQGFRGLPPELQDAARLDGYGHLAFLWRFAVPLTRPVIASFTVISALGAWNQYLWPQAVIDEGSGQTAQIRLRGIVGIEIANANEGVAAALIVALPVVLLLVAFQRQIIRGLTAGAVKG
ncbi:MAG TPA: carbohydrate ABC transporter permease [Acidimicrobiales bacterium]|nr:carbohydrate ABC transporter permease [Acidimicrobiales bacterium]